MTPGQFTAQQQDSRHLTAVPDVTLSPSLQEAEAAAELAVATMHQMEQVSSMHSVSLLPAMAALHPHGSSLSPCNDVPLHPMAVCGSPHCTLLDASSSQALPTGMEFCKTAALHSILPGLCVKQALPPGMQVSTATRSLQQELAHRDSTIRALEAQVAQLQASELLPGQESRCNSLLSYVSINCCLLH